MKDNETIVLLNDLQEDVYEIWKSGFANQVKEKAKFDTSVPNLPRFMD